MAGENRGDFPARWNCSASARSNVIRSSAPVCRDASLRGLAMFTSLKNGSISTTHSRRLSVSRVTIALSRKNWRRRDISSRAPYIGSPLRGTARS